MKRTIFALFSATIVHCSGGTDGGLTLGVQTDSVASFNVLRVTTVTTATTTEAVESTRLPWEKKISAHASAPSVDVKVEAFDAQGNLVLTRTARAPLPPPSQNKLLRIRLESACQMTTCTAPHQTCIAGRCQNDELLLGDLEPYRTEWASDVADICRPLNAGAPEVIVGTGQTDYLPLTPGQTLQAELGPQGGHHLYVALRQRNLHRAGSVTTITAKQPDSGVEIPPTAFVFTFDPDEGGYCKLHGLRYQLDNGGVDYKQFLDKDLDLTVSVRDTNANIGSGTMRIHVAPTILGM
jgi:hypothetical protein